MYRFKIPDRWTDYVPFGEAIVNTPIVAVKTPLEQIFRRSQRVPDGLLSEQMFTPTQLVDGLLNKSHLLSLVIDLTNTARYYNPKEFEDRGVRHVKIRCPGQTIPPDSVYKQFCTELERWLERAKEGEVVAVHCTHGLNRTGYLVCRYMMEHKGLSFKSAVAAFNEARRHDIENQEYLDHLKQGCPPLPDPPPAPGHDAPPTAADSRAPTRLPDNTDNEVPFRKKPRYGDNSGGSPRQQPVRDHHQSTYHGQDGRRRGDYGYHGNHHKDQSHWDDRRQHYRHHYRGTPDQQWSAWQPEPHYQWEPPSDFNWRRGEGMHDHRHHHSDRAYGQWDGHRAHGSGRHDRKYDKGGNDRKYDKGGHYRKYDKGGNDRRYNKGGNDRSGSGGHDRSGSGGHDRRSYNGHRPK